MSPYTLAAAIGEVRDDYLLDAETASCRRPRVRWAALCACLLVLAVLPFAAYRLKNTAPEDPAAEMAALEYNGAYYEFTDNPEILEKYGLPAAISAAQAGAHLAYLQQDGAGYKVCAQETDAELLTYAPAPCDGVLVVRDGRQYGAALFCNHILSDDDCASLSALYRVYGVARAEDIVSVCEFNGIFGHEKTANLITDRDALDAFYNASLALEAISNEDFQATEIETAQTEEKRIEAYEALAADAIRLRIETAAGPVFFVDAYPAHGWLEADLSYFRFSEAMARWFSENIH